MYTKRERNGTAIDTNGPRGGGGGGHVADASKRACGDERYTTSPYVGTKYGE